MRMIYITSGVQYNIVKSTRFFSVARQFSTFTRLDMKSPFSLGINHTLSTLPPPVFRVCPGCNFSLEIWIAEPAERYISDCSPSEIGGYLQAVDVIQQSVTIIAYHSQAKEAIFLAVARLKLEFQHILTRLTATPARPIGDINSGPNSTSISSSVTVTLVFSQC